MYHMLFGETGNGRRKTLSPVCLAFRMSFASNRSLSDFHRQLSTSTIYRPLSTVHCLLSTAHHPPSPPSIHCPVHPVPSTIHPPLSHPPLAVHFPLSVVHHPQAIHSLPSPITTHSTMSTLSCLSLVFCYRKSILACA